MEQIARTISIGASPTPVRTVLTAQMASRLTTAAVTLVTMARTVKLMWMNASPTPVSLVVFALSGRILLHWQQMA